MSDMSLQDAIALEQLLANTIEKDSGKRKQRPQAEPVKRKKRKKNNIKHVNDRGEDEVSVSNEYRNLINSIELGDNEDFYGGDSGSEAEEENVQEGNTPCTAPKIAALRRELGNPDPQEECFGCTRGRIGQAVTDMEGWNQMLDLWKNSYKDADWVVLAKQMYKLFEEKVRRPANAYLEFGQTPIPEWSAINIFYHFYQ